MSTPEKYTTLAAWALAVCRALEEMGIDPTPLLETVEIDRNQLTQHPDGRVEIVKMTRFWKLLEKTTGDQAFGLKVAQHVQPMHFRALGLLMLTTENLENAILKLGQYSALVSNSTRVRLEHKSDLIGFAIDPIPNVEISKHAIDSFFATLKIHGQRECGSKAFIEKVELLRPRPSSPEPWLTFFDAPVEFGASQNCVWLRREVLRQSSIMGDEKLAAYNESVVQDYVENLNAKGWSEKVHLILLNQLDKNEPSLACVASILEVGERTLRRHLKEENSNFRQLLQSARMEMANHYLLSSDLAMTDIALRLSFTDASNFSRAFQRWHGISPSEYRKQHTK